MSAMHDRLGAVIDSDGARFSGEDFAASRLGAVAGAVKRRRAARAAGVGGVSVVGASALAAGAANIPWGSLVYGVGPGSPSVVCTTSTPDAVAGSATDVPEEAVFAVVDNASSDVVFVGWRDDGNTAVVWGAGGTEVQLEEVDGHAEYTFASGTVVTIFADGTGGYGDGVQHAEDIAVMPVDAYLAKTALEAASDTNTGTAVPVTGVGDDETTGWGFFDGDRELATATLEGRTLRVETPGEGVQEILPDADGVYRFVASGEHVALSFEDLALDRRAVTLTIGEATGGEQPADDLVASESTPTVNCVTTSPEPTASESPSTAPTPAPTWSFDPQVPTASPFQCGYEFATEEGSTGVVSIGEATWLTPDEALAAIAEPYGGSYDPGLDFSGEPVPVVSVNIDSDWAGILQHGAYVAADPASAAPGYINGPDNQPVYGGFVAGSQYVLVADGVVVAMFDYDGPSAPQYNQAVESVVAAPLYGLNLTAGMVACDGVSDDVLASAQPVAVAGVRLVDDGETVEGPYYAWRFVGRP